MSASYNHFLKISHISAIYEFLHHCVDDLIEKSNTNFENYYNGDIELTQEDCEKACSFIQNLYRVSVMENHLKLPGDMSTNLQEAVTHCYMIRKNDIFQALARDYILQKDHNLVNNVDWRLKWVLGSSSLATLHSPLLQVDLHCSKKNGDDLMKNTINFEADLQQIDNLLMELIQFQKEFH
ncbi:hypothetical protein NQ315_017274 [Exocentrus adspersus]|uniref:COMM domain-containing protein n=1 Tax=Exocentrus adspersus TaxID=1586481 RepID=A0AAV8VFG8_9CUCU|nr:hypothetical protein NQ315_017274 [Exocentrus adspersus]